MHHLPASLEPADEAGPMSATQETPKRLDPARGKSARRPLAPSTSARRAALVAEFQSDAIAIEHRPPPRLARVTLYAVIALIATCVIWASVSHIDTIVTAQGK